MHIELKHLQKHYITENGSIRAVDNLNWKAECGKIYGVLGPNGSGKTSTIKMLLNLLHPDSGEIYINDKKWGNRSEEFRRQLGYLPEERGLYKKDKTLELLVYIGQLKGLTRSDARSKALQLLKQFELEASANAPLESLSKGMSQKIQLITAIIHTPTLVVLDEPFSGLDPVNVRAVRNVITELKEQGALVILCTHRMDEAERLCDEILMLRKGKIALCGSQRSLREAQGVGHITLSANVSLEHFTTVKHQKNRGDLQEVFLKDERTTDEFLSELTQNNIIATELHITPVSLEELYIRAADEV